MRQWSSTGNSIAGGYLINLSLRCNSRWHDQCLVARYVSSRTWCTGGQRDTTTSLSRGIFDKFVASARQRTPCDNTAGRHPPTTTNGWHGEASTRITGVVYQLDKQGQKEEDRRILRVQEKSHTHYPPTTTNGWHGEASTRITGMVYQLDKQGPQHERQREKDRQILRVQEKSHTHTTRQRRRPQSG